MTPNQDDAATKDSGSTPVPAEDPSKSVVETLKRSVLTERELKSPGVQRMLAELVERLEDELREAKEFRERFHKVDKELAALLAGGTEAKKRRLVANAGLIVSSAALGAAPSFMTNPALKVYGEAMLGFAIVIFAASLVAQVWPSWN